MTRIHRPERRSPFTRGRARRLPAQGKTLLENLTAKLMNALFARWPERVTSGVRPQNLTLAIVPKKPEPGRGAERAQRRRLNAAYAKVWNVTSDHGRKLAARALELAQGELSLTERAFRRLGFGWKS